MKPARLVAQVPGNEDLAHLASLSPNKPHAEEKPRLVVGAWYMDAYGNAVGPMASDNGYLFHCLSGAWVGNAKWFSDGSVASRTYIDGSDAEPAPLVARIKPPSGASSGPITIEEALLDPGKPNKNYDGLSFDQAKLKKIIEQWAKTMPSWSHQPLTSEVIYDVTGGKAVKRSLPLPAPKKPDPPKQVQPYKPPVRRRLQIGRAPEQPDPPTLSRR